MKAPTMLINNRVAKAQEMLFIQDIIIQTKRQLVFFMKLEVPRTAFTKEVEQTFQTIKTCGYYALSKDTIVSSNVAATASPGAREVTEKEEDDDEKENGFVFLDL